MRMKKTFRIAWLIFALGVMLPVIPVVFDGCTTATQTVTYKTLAAIGQTVNSAYAGYLDAVIKGSVPQSSVPNVSKLYNDFQTAYGLAISAAQFNPNATAPQNIVDLSNQLVTTIATLKGTK